MLDKTIPYHGVIMIKHNPKDYPRFLLPEGFTISGYQAGLEEQWAQLQFDLGQVDSLDEGRKLVAGEFMTSPELLFRQCLFVLDEKGAVAATGALWPGEHFGAAKLRLHWIATRADCQGRGLIKALLTRLLDLFDEMGGGDFIYLTSQTWSYKALNLYSKFGFQAYRGEKPVNWVCQNNSFEEENTLAWDLINGRLAERGVCL